MEQLPIFSRLYVRLVPHRRALLLATVLALAASMALFFRIEIGENIQAMLPDAPDGPLRDFEFMQQAPFARKIVITVQDQAGLGPDTLVLATAGLAGALDPALFTRVVGDPADLMGNASGPQFLDFFVRNLPNLLTEQDLDELGARIEPVAVRRALAGVASSLRGPESLVLKELLRKDPLDFRQLALRKLQHLNLAPRLRIHNGRFVSQDQKSGLLIAETVIPMTDFGGAARLSDAFDRAKAAMPTGMTASMLCGHLYTLANARAIQQDLPVLLTVSCLSMLLLFLVFLHTRMAVQIFLLPFFAVCIGGVAVALAYKPVSGVTLGFGAVLLGMASDYAVYVYVPLRRGAAPPAKLLGQLTRPLLFCCLTTLAGFAVLAVSDLPGQRQLAVFSLAGLSAALLLALVVLPHLVRPGAPKQSSAVLARALDGLGRSCRRRHRLVIGIWALALLAALWPASRVRVNGDLRALGIIPAELRASEAAVRETWGDMRGQALLFAVATEEQRALETNDAVFTFLRRQFPDAPVASIAPLLPSYAAQDRNRRAWDVFWKENAQRLKAEIRSSGREFGFSQVAFQPFFDSLEAAPPDIVPAELRALGLGDVLDTFMPAPSAGQEQAPTTRVLTLAPDRADILDAFNAAPEGHARLEIPLAIHDVRPVAQSRFAAELSRALSKDFVRFVLATSGLVLLLLTLMFKDLKKVALSLIPAGAGLLALGGVMGLSSMNLTIYNILASVLIISSGVDYGIFMVQRLDKGFDHHTELALLLAGASTLVGFGVLVLAQHPALHSIGLTVLIGMLVAIAAALVLVPALYSPQDKGNA